MKLDSKQYQMMYLIENKLSLNSKLNSSRYVFMTHNQIDSTTCYVHASITVKWTLIKNIQLVVTSSNNQKTVRQPQNY